jgi:hypothetical protein
MEGRYRLFYVVDSTGRCNTLIFWRRWSVGMKQRRRIYYSAVQRSEIWDRWQAGESMSSIGRRFDRESSSVSRIEVGRGASVRRSNYQPDLAH